MNLQITKMQIKDFEIIKDCLQKDFDDFWSPSLLKKELENNQKLNSHYFIAKNRK